MKTYQKSTLIIAVCVTMLLTLLLTVSVMRLISATHPLEREVSQFRELRELISARFIGEHDEAALTEAALAATIDALGDPWSRYLTQAQYEDHMRRSGNQQQGLGISFDRDEETGDVLIFSVVSNSPADHAGLRAGDSIITIADYDTRDLDNDEVRDVVIAHFGQSLRLYVRSADGETRTTYAEIGPFYVNPVYDEMLEDNIGLVSIMNFDSRSGVETVEAVERLYEAGATAIVFDLRYNPGGRVDELLRVLDFLLPEGELFVFEDENGVEMVYHAEEEYFSIPMVVLINEHSFSAAEFFAAILQEEGAAYIVGQPTSGKSRSQQMFPLPSGGAVAISTRRYLTPNRVDLYEAGGIQPDFVVAFGDSGEDLQLQKAIQLLRP